MDEILFYFIKHRDDTILIFWLSDLDFWFNTDHLLFFTYATVLCFTSTCPGKILACPPASFKLLAPPSHVVPTMLTTGPGKYGLGYFLKNNWALLFLYCPVLFYRNLLSPNSIWNCTFPSPILPLTQFIWELSPLQTSILYPIKMIKGPQHENLYFF